MGIFIRDVMSSEILLLGSNMVQGGIQSCRITKQGYQHVCLYIHHIQFINIRLDNVLLAT